MSPVVMSSFIFSILSLLSMVPFLPRYYHCFSQVICDGNKFILVSYQGAGKSMTRWTISYIKSLNAFIARQWEEKIFENAFCISSNLLILTHIRIICAAVYWACVMCIKLAVHMPYTLKVLNVHKTWGLGGLADVVIH